MTKLTDEQHDLLARIGHLYARRKAVKHEVLSEIDVLIADRTARINETLHQEVREALDSGTPKRRILMALGTSDYGTLNKLIENALGEVATVAVEGIEKPEPTLNIVRNDNHATVVLSNYLLGGDVVSGTVVFYLSGGQWLVTGDSATDFAVERALFGSDVDETLRAAFDAAVSP